MEQQQLGKLRRSSSRSPSLTRSQSLKEKPVSSGIVKHKKKGSGNKKERWLLTRKTWRYMQDAVGSLLPEHKDKTRSNSPTGPSTSTSSRRPSSSLSSPATPTAPVAPTVHSYSTGVVPAGHGYTSHIFHQQPQPWPLYSPITFNEKRSSVARSSICSGSGYVPLEAEPDIPALEDHFENVCKKEKKFILWNRTKAKGLSGPALRKLKMKDPSRTSSGSSIPEPQSPETPRPEQKLEYCSPEDEDLMDDYDEYEPDEEQMTVREIPQRKGSSGASSVVSLVSAGLSFFRPQSHTTHHSHQLSSPPPTDGSGDNHYVISFGHGVQKYVRNKGIQTDPFPEEILIRLRLQSVREEQLQRQESANTLKETNTKEQDILGHDLSSEIHEHKAPPSESSVVSADMDKKSEESGYSSSISDTVMRYLRMVRKNSKPDKETIDRFKTVNYDRSLRNIKSKYVTAEEVIEHEKNKALQAQQKDQNADKIEETNKEVKGIEKIVTSEKNSTPTPIAGSSKLGKPGKKSTGLKKGRKGSTAKGEMTEDAAAGIGTLSSIPPLSPVESPSSPDNSTPPLSPPPELPLTPPPVEIPGYSSIGIQAGESLIHFLKNFNLTRKFSDISSYGSSESPGDVTSPRYSIATGSDASDTYLQLHTSSEGQRSSHYYGETPSYGRGRGGGDIDHELLFSYNLNRNHPPPSPSYSFSPSLKKSSTTLQMRSSGSSPYLYSGDHHPQDYGTYGPSSVSSPTTPIISTNSKGLLKELNPESTSASSRHIPPKTGSLYSQPPSSSSSYATSAAQFLSGLRSSSKGSRDQYTSSGSGGGLAESISSFISKHSVISSPRSKQSGNDSNSNVSFKESLRRVGSGKSSSKTHLPPPSSSYSTASDPNSNLSSSLVMQKSKSSSSVFHPLSSGEKRGSTSSTGGGLTPGSSGSRLISKTRIFKSRSKSAGRTTPACTWTPQGKCTWTSTTGRQVTLETTNVLTLSEKELETLQQVALAKLQALNLGVEIKIPREKVVQNQKPKRRPYLLKKKALSTGFFDSGTKEGQDTTLGGSGLVFGIPLSQCIQNDKRRELEKNSGSGESRAVISDLEGSQHKRSQNGSRNSVSSVFETKDKTGSSESLFWGKRGSSGGLDPLSSSTGDILAAENIPQSTSCAAVPSVVKACINFLETYGLHTTGIFRVSTSLKRIRQLREDIDSGKEIIFTQDYSPHDIAALLKEYLRDLPEPLLCRDLYNAFLKTQKIRNRRLQLEAVQHLIQLLPLPNRDTLAAILKFFAKVVDNAFDKKTTTGETLNGNKMESYSLATLIAPNILPFISPPGSIPSGDPNSTQTRERRESIDVVNYMITNYEELFEISPELLDEVYVHLMDTDPELVENILKQKSGPILDDHDDLETTSSVFEGSESGENWEDEATGGIRKFQKREDIVHKDGGKGGQYDMSGLGKATRSRRDGSKDRSGTSEAEKQSGGESDSSSTKSATRWFRRPRADPKTRTSSDSGSEKLKGKRRDSSLGEAKRASSLDSVNLKESMSSKIAAVTEHTDRQRSSSDQNLKVPEAISRRQSSPVLESSGIITASLKIPVPLNIDDSDIPFIEEENSEGHQRILLTQQQPVELVQGSDKSRGDAGILSRSGTQSLSTSPMSTPNRQPSTPMTMSPPCSPPYDPTTFPYEEMTARFLIGGPGQSSTQPSPATSTLVTKTKLSQLPAMGTLTVLPLETSQSQKDIYAPTQTDPKQVGKETKGANIAGLIKSKTADFEKFAKEQQSTSPSSTSIAPNLRLRSQGNIQLKQQFLLRQQQQQMGGGPPSPSRSSSGTLASTGDRHRPLTRKKPITTSASATSLAQPQQPNQPAASRWKRSEIIASRSSGGGGGKAEDDQSTSDRTN